VHVPLALLMLTDRRYDIVVPGTAALSGDVNPRFGVAPPTTQLMHGTVV
jgi:hypothetical protein